MDPGGGFWKSALYVVVPVTGVMAEMLALDGFGRPGPRGACSTEVHISTKMSFVPFEAVRIQLEEFRLKQGTSLIEMSVAAFEAVQFGGFATWVSTQSSCTSMLR